MMKSTANQQKKRGTKFIASAVLLTFLFLSQTALSEGTGQTPYPGPDLHAIPGRIEAENYDSDGENISFHDSDSINEGSEYRTDGVDMTPPATPTGYGYCGDGVCNPEEDCWSCEADCGVCSNPTWQVDARCFLDGPSGEFDDISVKDPSIVYYGGKWHLFYTGRDVGVGGHYRMGYASATTIPELNSATRYYLSALKGGSYFCAPQVFWFEEKGTWYLIYQSGLGPTFSTNTDISDPNGWTAGKSMGFSGGVVDYWCISDGSYVYCFYSPLGTTILRRRTTIENFPYNWSEASTVATKTFEAPHVYKNLADGKYYLMVEDVSRHFELWVADTLDGTWTKIDENWANGNDLVFNADHWTDQVSHGEILRAGVNEKLEINSINRCEILIQGVVNGSYGDYGNIPYDLGIIRQRCPAKTGDINLDCGVDFKDFAVLAEQWLQLPCVPSADIAPSGGDGIVDMNDLSSLVDSWLWGR